jgi:hypothetical protein
VPDGSGFSGTDLARCERSSGLFRPFRGGFSSLERLSLGTLEPAPGPSLHPLRTVRAARCVGRPGRGAGSPSRICERRRRVLGVVDDRGSDAISLLNGAYHALSRARRGWRCCSIQTAREKDADDRGRRWRALRWPRADAMRRRRRHGQCPRQPASGGVNGHDAATQWERSRGQTGESRRPPAQPHR